MPSKEVSSEDYLRLKELTFQSSDQENEFYRELSASRSCRCARGGWTFRVWFAGFFWI